MFSLQEPTKTLFHPHLFQSGIHFQPMTSKQPTFNIMTFDSEMSSIWNDSKNQNTPFIQNTSQNQVLSYRHPVTNESTNFPIPFVIPMYDTPMLRLDNHGKILFSKCNLFPSQSHPLPNRKPRKREMGNEIDKLRVPFYKKKKPSSKRVHQLENEMASLQIHNQPSICKRSKKKQKKTSKRLPQLEHELAALQIHMATDKSCRRQMLPKRKYL